MEVPVVDSASGSGGGGGGGGGAVASAACEAGGSGASCACRERGVAPAASLAVLQQVHRAYEERLQVIDSKGGKNKLELQVEVLRAWVADLVGQNTLLSRAVEDLEREATARLVVERNKHAEMDKRKKPGCDLKQLRSVNDSLQKENLSKDREIRRLNMDLQRYEQTIVNIRNEGSYRGSQESQKKDAQVMVGMCCTKNELAAGGGGACDDRDAHKYQERIRKMETSLKSSSENVRALRRVNVALSEELHALRRVCAALDEQCRSAALRATFKDEIIREMRRQLKQAKAKIKESENPTSKTSRLVKVRSEASLSSPASLPVACGPCVMAQPRRGGTGYAATVASAGVDSQRPSHDSDDCRSPRFDGSGDDL